MEKTAALLAPLGEAIAAHVRVGNAIHVDDTPIDVLSPGRGKTMRGRLCPYMRDERSRAGAAPPAPAFYLFSMDRKAVRPAEHLTGYRGFVHSDGYAGFKELFRSDGIEEVACLAHVRRKFFDLARDGRSTTAAEAVAPIAQPYAIENESRGQPPDNRAAIRQAKARPVLGELAAWLRIQPQKISAKSDIARAIRHALTRLPPLAIDLADCRLDIDNGQSAALPSDASPIDGLTSCSINGRSAGRITTDIAAEVPMTQGATSAPYFQNRGGYIDRRWRCSHTQRFRSHRHARPRERQTRRNLKADAV